MKNKVAKNAVWIISCRICQALFQLIISMLTARYLGPSNYGLINYAASLVAFFSPIMQLGLTGILVQELINNPQREGQTMGTAVMMNVASGVLCVAGLIAFAYISALGEVETTIVCALYSINMLMEAVHILQYWFQAKLLSKYTSLAMLAAYVIASVYQIVLLALGKSIYWFAISKALDIAIIDVILVVLYFHYGGQRLCFSREVGKSMLQRSKYYIWANMMVVIFAQTDRVMLKIMIDDAATGYYSAAVTCAGMTSFVFSAIIDSMRPSILESKKKNETDYRRNMTTLYSIVIYLSLAQSIVIALGAPVMVDLLYGAAYYLSIDALRIIIWYTTFSYLGAVRNVWILAENKHNILWKVNLAGAVANIFLNLLLIPIWGVNGAAFASLVTQIITNVFLCFVVYELRPTVAFMLDSLNIKQLCLSFKQSVR